MVRHVLFVALFSTVCGKNITGDEEYYWTQWYNEDTPYDGIGDKETQQDIESSLGYSVCDDGSYVSQIECRTNVNGDWILFQKAQSDLAPDVLFIPCDRVDGLECRNTDQPSGSPPCHDYYVRFLCYPKGQDIKGGGQPSSLAALMALILVPVIIVLSLKFRVHRRCRRHSSDSDDISRSSYNLTTEQQATFDPPPSYNSLFHTGTGNVYINYGADLNEESQVQQNQNNRPNRPNDLQLSATELARQYQGTIITPPPDYDNALKILAANSKEHESNNEISRDQYENDINGTATMIPNDANSRNEANSEENESLVRNQANIENQVIPETESDQQNDDSEIHFQNDTESHAVFEESENEDLSPNTENISNESQIQNAETDLQVSNENNETNIQNEDDLRNQSETEGVEREINDINEDIESENDTKIIEPKHMNEAIESDADNEIDEKYQHLHHSTRNVNETDAHVKDDAEITETTSNVTR